MTPMDYAANDATRAALRNTTAVASSSNAAAAAAAAQTAADAASAAQRGAAAERAARDTEAATAERQSAAAKAAVAAKEASATQQRVQAVATAAAQKKADAAAAQRVAAAERAARDAEARAAAAEQQSAAAAAAVAAQQAAAAAHASAAASVPADVAALLSSLSLSAYGPALVDKLGVASCADLARLKEAHLKEELPTMRVAERLRLLEAVAPAPAPAAAAPAAAGVCDVMISYRVPETGDGGDKSVFALADALEARGYRVFVGEAAIEGGSSWPATIQRGGLRRVRHPLLANLRRRGSLALDATRAGAGGQHEEAAHPRVALRAVPAQSGCHLPGRHAAHPGWQLQQRLC
jgi:hypothetical protein